MNNIRKFKYKSLESGSAENIDDFFNQLVKSQFENKETIKHIHKSLIKYINLDNPTFFLRLYGSFTKDKYDQQRRGFLTEYLNKTRMVFCDNTFSMQFISFKLANIPYTIEDLQRLFTQDKLICGFGQVSLEKELCFYTPRGAYNPNLNSKGWYLAHINPTGYSFLSREDTIASYFQNPKRDEWDKTTRIRKCHENLTDEQLKVLKAHFVRLIHPLNSFLVPKPNQSEYNGKRIGEEKELLIHVQNFIEFEFPEEYKEFKEIALIQDIEKPKSKIGRINWFETPKENKKALILKEEINAKEEIIFEEDSLVVNLDESLKSIGKEVFLNILFPEIQNNEKVIAQDLANKYKTYNNFSLNSQKSRLSSAKSIFKKGLEYEALQIIVESKRLHAEIREKANDYIKKKNR